MDGCFLHDLFQKNPSYTPTDVLLVNKGNNQEEIFLKTNALATGLEENDSDNIYYTHFVSLVRNSEYKLLDNFPAQFSLLTVHPKIKIPKFARKEGILHKTYFDENEKNDTRSYISTIFNLASLLQVKVLILQDVASSNGYLHPKEDILCFVYENISKYKYNFDKIYFCYS